MERTAADILYIYIYIYYCACFFPPLLLFRLVGAARFNRTYLFPRECNAPLELPSVVEAALTIISSSSLSFSLFLLTFALVSFQTLSSSTCALLLHHRHQQQNPKLGNATAAANPPSTRSILRESLASSPFGRSCRRRRWRCCCCCCCYSSSFSSSFVSLLSRASRQHKSDGVT